MCNLYRALHVKGVFIHRVTSFTNIAAYLDIIQIKGCIFETFAIVFEFLHSDGPGVALGVLTHSIFGEGQSFWGYCGHTNNQGTSPIAHAIHL